MKNLIRFGKVRILTIVVILCLTAAVFASLPIRGVHATPQTDDQLVYANGTPTKICQIITVYEVVQNIFGPQTETVCTGISATVRVDTAWNNPSYDFYAVTLSAYDFSGTNPPSAYLGTASPPGEWVVGLSASIIIPDSTIATMFSTTGTTDSSQQSNWNIGGCVAGVCLNFGGTGPAQHVVWSLQSTGGKTFVNWAVTIPGGLGFDQYTKTIISGSQADFGLFLQAPKGAAFNIGFSTLMTIMYEKDNFPNYGTTGYNNGGQLPVDPKGTVFSSLPLSYGNVGALVQSDITTTSDSTGTHANGHVYYWAGYTDSGALIAGGVNAPVIGVVNNLVVSNGLINFVVNIASSPYWLGIGCTETVASGSVSCAFIGRTPDINHDGWVNILDLADASGHFGTSQGSPNFKPEDDIIVDGSINIQDLATVAFWFGSPAY
jgi:hypothetical protein